MPKPKAPSKARKISGAPLAKSTAKPPVKTAAKPIPKSAAKSFARSAAKSEAKPVTKRGAKPTTSPKAKIVMKKAIRPIAKPDNGTVVDPVTAQVQHELAAWDDPIVEQARPELPAPTALNVSIEAESEAAPKAASAENVNSIDSSNTVPKKKPAIKSSAKQNEKPSLKSALKKRLSLTAKSESVDTAGSGSRIRKLRLAVHMTQEQLAERLSALGSPVSRSAIAQWETDRATPDGTHIEHLSVALSTTVEFLRTSRIDDVTPVEMLVMQRMRRMSLESLNLLVAISDRILSGETKAS